ncbi:MAG: phosphate/phosphite/phosphonate ABC transporter substrate-binding protein [Thiohalomonadales bacterium]
MKYILSVFVLIICIPAFAVENKRTYIFGVFPHLPKHKLLELYDQVAINFSVNLKNKIRIKTKSSFESFEATLRAEEFDIVLIQPFDYPDAHDKYNYLPLAKRSDKLFSILLVKKESSFKSIKDLKNRTIANPAKSAAVTRLTDRTMIKNGFNPQKDFIRKYKSNHFSCMQSVLIGTSDACGTSYRALLHYEDEKMKNRFRVVNTSEKIPHVLYIVHKRVPKTDREILLKTILNWPNSPEGRRILKTSRMVRFEKANDNDYDILRNK